MHEFAIQAIETQSVMKASIAIKILLAIIIAVTLFHGCIILKIIPYEVTWGGRLKNDTDMYAYEGLSLLLNFILGVTLLIKGNFIKQMLPLKVIQGILWVFFVLFVLNTVGNLFAATNFEKFFSILTLALALLLWVVLRSKKIG